MDAFTAKQDKEDAEKLRRKSAEAKSAGFPIALYLDAKEQKCATTTPAPPPLARVQPSVPVRA